MIPAPPLNIASSASSSTGSTPITTGGFHFAPNAGASAQTLWLMAAAGVLLLVARKKGVI